MGAVVFLAGLTALVFEVTYNRMLGFVLGSTVRSSAIVLSAYMSGLAAGSIFFGRFLNGFRADRLLALLLLYKGLAGAAIYAALHALISLEDSNLILNRATSVAIGAFVAIFLHALAGGGFLPVFYRIALEDRRRMPADIGHYFALEAAGAAVGALAVGFLAIRFLGQHLTVIGAASVCILLALFVARRSPGRGGTEEGTVTFRDQGNWAIYTHAFVLGFVGLALQVVWIRALRVYLQNSTYTFSLVVFMAIASIFLGGLVYKRAALAIGDRIRLLERLLWPYSLAAAATVLCLVKAPRWIILPLYDLLGDPLLLMLLPALTISLIMVVPVGLISGFCFPLCCSIVTRRPRSAGISTGTLALANYLGALLGPLATAYVFMQHLGLIRSIFLLSGLPILGLVLTRLLRKELRPLPLALGAAWIGAAVLLALASREFKVLPVQLHAPSSDAELVHYQETPAGFITVARDRGGTHSVFVDNSFVIGSSYDAMKVVRMLGHLPFLAGLEGGNALVVGYGAGVTTSVIASYPQIESVTCVELAAGLAETSHFFSRANADVIRSPKLRLIEGDGRRYLAGTLKTYDLISSDPTHPILGSHSIYTYEYFRLCRRRLSAGGIVSHYMPLHLLLPADFLGILKTFQRIFPDMLLFMSHRHAVLLGSNREFRIDFLAWIDRARRIKDPLFLSDPYLLAAKLYADGATIATTAAAHRINRDDRSPVEFFDFRSTRPENWALNARFLRSIRTDPQRVLRNVPLPPLLARHVAGNDLLMDALIDLHQGRHEHYRKKLLEARRINPENVEYELLLRH